MAENESNQYGQICWFEVPVTSLPRAIAFYSAVLGWECPDLEGLPAPGNYAKSVHMFNKGSLHGAFLLMPDENGVANIIPNGKIEQLVPIAAYMVESIDETVVKIETSGGKVHVPKTHIGDGMGYYARFIDSEGNLQGLWSKN